MKLDRVAAFSDGIFAVAATLLVLDLKIDSLKDPHSAVELKDRLVEQLPKFYSWLISFFIVCKFWVNHHHILALASRATFAMVWLNSIFLMFQTLIPFLTDLMGEFHQNSLAVCLFGVVLAFNTLLFIALHAYILARVMKPEFIGTQPPHVIRNSFFGVAFYLMGAAMAWYNVRLAFLIYGIMPMFFIVPGPRASSATGSHTHAQE